MRKHEPYDAYDLVSFEVPLGGSDGGIARYRCRMEEMRQSCTHFTAVWTTCLAQPLPPMPPFLLMLSGMAQSGQAPCGGSLRQVICDNHIL